MPIFQKIIDFLQIIRIDIVFSFITNIRKQNGKFIKTDFGKQQEKANCDSVIITQIFTKKRGDFRKNSRMRFRQKFIAKSIKAIRMLIEKHLVKNHFGGIKLPFFPL